MVTKKVRTEYMKKFKDPKWETFTKCYEDSLKYRLTRRVMEHSHNPWFWEGWESGSNSSGWSTPRLTRNKVVPLSLPPPPTSSEVQHRLLELKIHPDPEPSSEARRTEPETGESVEPMTAPAQQVKEPVSDSGLNGPSTTSGPSDDTATSDRPEHSGTSDEEPPKPSPRRRHRCRAPRPAQGHPDSPQEEKPTTLQKPQRAKSQPPASSKGNRRALGRLDWTQRHVENHTPDAGVRTQPNKRSSTCELRRARSADLDKLRRSQLNMAADDDRWMTEYMRCFSARLR